jgi:hypothetical protein
MESKLEAIDHSLSAGIAFPSMSIIPVVATRMSEHKKRRREIIKGAAGRHQ